MANLFAGLGTTTTNKAASTTTAQAPTESYIPEYPCNKIAIRMNKGTVAVAGIIGEEFCDAYIANPYFTSKKPACNEPNVISALCDIIESILNDDETKTQRTVIAIPGQVFAVVNNLDVLTQIVWTGVHPLQKTSENKARAINEKEKVLYARLLNDIAVSTGIVRIQDSKYTHMVASTAVTNTQKEWTKINASVRAALNDKTPVDDDEAAF